MIENNPGNVSRGVVLNFIINHGTRLRRSGFGGQVKSRMGDGGDED